MAGSPRRSNECELQPLPLALQAAMTAPEGRRRELRVPVRKVAGFVEEQRMMVLGSLLSKIWKSVWRPCRIRVYCFRIGGTLEVEEGGVRVEVVDRVSDV